MSEYFSYDIEAKLRDYFSLNFNDVINSLKPIPADPDKKISETDSPERCMLSMTKSYQDIYYSNFGKIKEEFKYPDDETSKRTILELWHKGMDYIHIIECETYNPEYRELDNTLRWMAAVLNTTSTINPLISLPEIEHAEPVVSLSPENSPGDIYNSFLRYWIQAQPQLKLNELDRLIYSTMNEQGMNPKLIKECFRYGNPLFSVPDISDDVERLKAIHDINNEFDKYYFSLSNHLNTAARTEADEERNVYAELYKYIQEKQTVHRDGNLEEYWRDSLKKINDALIIVMGYQNQTKQALKVIKLWAEGIDMAAKEFGFRHQQDINGIKKTISEMLDKAGKAETDWQKIMEIVEKVDRFGREILESKKNPLLSSVPELRQVRPGYRIEKNSKFCDMYFSALKSEVVNNIKINLVQADLLIAFRLMKAKVSVLKITEIISNSPQFRDFPKDTKRKMARDFVIKARQKIMQERGGRKQGVQK